ncbi:hypothetical protein [Arcticibacter tournemirensis]|uniref:Uncharacterized protein n=1 Tax=Arcticibacter tournemirensis TaxID=699437 RepID=A0A4Q0MBK8_9SPHI|nr:hypothetical protein [Arcticibacter tournemirensis]RXF70687.1 hypothetical protein EKH83_08600 [Arcticibacter tournemirensis]
MEEPFDIESGHITYSVFPEEDGVYTIFKEGIEYMKIQKDEGEQWLKLDPETDLPLFGVDEEVNLIGGEILRYKL